MRSTFAKWAVLTLAITLTQCNPVTLDFYFIYSDTKVNTKIMRKLETVLESEYNVDIHLYNNGPASTPANLDSLVNGDLYQFSLIENHAEYRDGIGSVVTFFPQILHIWHKAEIPAMDFAQLMTSHSIFLDPESMGLDKLMKDLFEVYEIPDSLVSYEKNFENDPDIYIAYRDLLDERSLAMVQNYELFSFDDINNPSGITEGLTLRIPQLKPFVIPKHIYGKNEAAATLSSDLVLVASDKVGATAVSDLISTIFDKKREFLSISPLIYNGLVHDFNRDLLNFPLHLGAQEYLDRDEPSFFERYAELFGVVFSLILATISGIISYTRWRARKKKDRIDVFYADLLRIKKALPTVKEKKQMMGLLGKVKRSEATAFDLLIDEKLEANDSFRIFMELTQKVEDEIKMRIKSL